MVLDMNYWSKVIRRLIIFVVMVLGVYIAFKFAVFYMPFLIAFILSMLIEPIIRFFMKKFKLKRRTSSIIVFAIVISVITGISIWGIATIIRRSF